MSRFLDINTPNIIYCKLIRACSYVVEEPHISACNYFNSLKDEMDLANIDF